MQHSLWSKLAALLAIAMLVFTVSCNKKTVAVDNETVGTMESDDAYSSDYPDSDVAEDEMDAPVASQEEESTAMDNLVMHEEIFFEFDKFTLTQAARETLIKNADWLRMNPDVIITIEGHCDERGTNEYNLALGDRRAETVKTFLVDLGIENSRLATISFGEERPSVLGHSEYAWAQNRRAHFVVK